MSSYLQAYTTALSKTGLKLAYVDAFAGAGVREISSAEQIYEGGPLHEEDKGYRHGSPLIALRTRPAFHTLFFIEKDPAALSALRSQIEDLPESNGRDIRFLEGDANEHIRDLSAKAWSGHRAVAFLDPFALQVNWTSIESIARTQAIDMWLLFPAMAVNRMLPRSGSIPSRWVDQLNRLFGASDWKQVFYNKEEPDLFGEEVISKTPRIFETLSDYVTQRLASIFSRTHEQPLILRNRTGSPLFLLCFASGNPKGAPIAVRIAQHIIDTSGYGKEF